VKTNEQWQIGGDAAELYERYVARYILGPWARGLIDAGNLQPGERALDLACGTGLVARIAAEKVGRSGKVTGLDLNGGMLAVARSLPPPGGASIDWIQRSASDTGLDSASFDVVLCQQGLQFFPDKLVALREARRVLAPGGRLAISVWRNTGVYNAAVGAALRRHLGLEIAQRFCASRDVPPGEELARLCLAAGMQDVKLRIAKMMIHLPSLQDFAVCHLAATPIADSLLPLNAEGRALLGREIAEALAQYREGDGITFPEETNIVTATV
jgi:ubiquinone/menaquinone biosynthesis C-methylase UbiE